MRLQICTTTYDNATAMRIASAFGSETPPFFTGRRLPEFLNQLAVI
ncbi:hypothetical protein SynBMKMC1_01109 [Synechococcus sp. BMK-MC-1]|nr:hypothetical protein SynBMKMC1_01109 [Synechococcus sp. BMK-MC-1]